MYRDQPVGIGHALARQRQSSGGSQRLIRRRISHSDLLAQVCRHDRQSGAGRADLNHGLGLHLRDGHGESGPTVDHGVLAEQDDFARRKTSTEDHALHLTGSEYSTFMEKETSGQAGRSAIIEL
jgi:hypothetical protein